MLIWYHCGMKSVETKAKRKRIKRNVRNAVLLTVGLAGLLTIAAVAPKTLRLLKVSGIDAKLRYRTKSVLFRLKQKGEIEFVERDGKKYARLTEHGERTLALLQQKMGVANGIKKKWDRRYRLVIFDIPERRKKTRDRLRMEMHELGFLRIQDSAWLYPHDCEELIALLKADLRIGKDVLYAVVEEIENDAWIKKHFGLPTN